MRLLCRYASGLACLVTALALVACGGGPGSQPEPKQIGNITFQQGEKVRTIPLSDKFSGENLTYTAESNRTSVATVAVDNAADTLTVTAAGPGTATITVTAKNSQGEAKQTFTVTVPEPPAPDPDPVEIPNIPSLEEDATRTIPLGDKFSGTNLTYGASSSDVRVATVTVDNTADTLTVTAVGPGTATITVTATAQGSAAQTQTFTVTVPRPVETPTVRTGAQPTVTVAQGATATITLSQVFTGTGLSFTVQSSDTAVARASESGGTLTITGVSVGGPATITIVARNTAGSSPAHTIAVTVTAPVTTPETPPPASSTLTIERGESAKRTLAAGQTLQGPPSGGVTVERSRDGETGNVWIITAKKKGSHKVSVLKDGKAVGTITVEVPNSRPVRQDQKGTGATAITLSNLKILLPSTSAKGTVYLTLDGTDTNTTVIADYFKDDDGDDIYYRIENKPSWFLVETENVFLKNVNAADPPTPFQLSYEVLQKVEPSNERDYEFTVSLYASDGEEEATRPVVIEFNVGDTTLEPRELDGDPTTDPAYEVDQDASGNFRDGNKDGSYNNRLEVGPRREVSHIVEFDGGAVGDAKTGFVFAENMYDTLPVADRTTDEDNSTALDTTLSVFYRDGSNVDKRVSSGEGDIPKGYQDPGTSYLLIRGSGAVEVVHVSGSKDITFGATPEVPFSLKRSGSSGSIIIEYKLWVHKNVVAAGKPNEGKTQSTKTVTKTLLISVLNCSSPPNPISACP